jgi:sec-independent protein translocase protein TatC
MSFFQHTEELLYRLRIILFSVVSMGVLVAFWPLDIRQSLTSIFSPLSMTSEYKPVVSFLMERMVADLLPEEASLIAGGMMDTAYVYLMMAMLVGILLSSPIVSYEFYKFFSPALYHHERRYAVFVISGFLILLLFGGLLSYHVILPITFRILMWFIGSTAALPLINVKDFVNMVITLVLGVAFLYTIPIYLILLVDRGILSINHLTSQRKLVYGMFIVITAVVTPDPTIVSDIILLGPFIIIYEVTILISKALHRRKIERKENALHLIEE